MSSNSKCLLVVASSFVFAGALTGCRCDATWGPNGSSVAVGGNPDTTTSMPTEAQAAAQDELAAARSQLDQVNNLIARSRGDEEKNLQGVAETWRTKIRELEAAQAPRVSAASPAAPASAGTVAPVATSSDQWFYWSGWGTNKSPFWAFVLVVGWMIAVFVLRDSNEGWAWATPVVITLIGAGVAALTPGSTYAGRLLFAGILFAAATGCLYRLQTGHAWRIPAGIVALLLFYALV